MRTAQYLVTAVQKSDYTSIGKNTHKHLKVCLFCRQSQYDQRIHLLPRTNALSPEACFPPPPPAPLPAEAAATGWMGRQMVLPELLAFQAPSHADVLSVGTDA